MAVRKLACAVWKLVRKVARVVNSVVKMVVAEVCCALVKSSSVVRLLTSCVAWSAGVGGVGGFEVLCAKTRLAPRAASVIDRTVQDFIKGYLLLLRFTACASAARQRFVGHIDGFRTPGFSGREGKFGAGHWRRSSNQRRTFESACRKDSLDLPTVLFHTFEPPSSPDSCSGWKIASIGCRKTLEMSKASGRLGPCFPISMEFTVCRDTESCAARSACDQRRSARNALMQFFICIGPAQRQERGCWLGPDRPTSKNRAAWKVAPRDFRRSQRIAPSVLHRTCSGRKCPWKAAAGSSDDSEYWYT